MSKKKELFIGAMITLLCTIISCLLTYRFTLLSIDYEISATEILSKEDLLKEAEKNYKIGNHEKVYKIYSDEKLATDPIALSNLAYMFENGIFVSKDITKAKELYEKAYLLGNKDALENWVLFCINYPSNNFISDLNKAYDLGSLVARDFLKEYFDYSDDDKYETFFNMPETTQLEILFNRVYKKVITDESIYLLGNDFITKKKLVQYDTDKFISVFNSQVDLGDSVPEDYKICNNGSAIFVKSPNTDVEYHILEFCYTLKNQTNFIYLQTSE